MPKVLHLLSQRPSLTGSGITVDALVREAAAKGWEQRVVVGVPASDLSPTVGSLDERHILPLRFGKPPLKFDVPGMSDVMPYPSTRFSAMTGEQLNAYNQAWREHLSLIVKDFQPDVIHTHHLWIMSSLARDVFPTTPIVAHCHGTCLRQMELCPHLAPDVIAGHRRLNRVAVLHEGLAGDVVRKLGIEQTRIDVVGAGFRDDLFHLRGRAKTNGSQLLYAGKYSNAKGLPWLLDAFEYMRAHHPDATLHIAGSGAGAEAESLRKRMEAMAPHVVLHGMLSQEQLARLMRRCDVFVLPSFYEGLPLVLIEALACGCRIVSTRLPCMRELAAHIGPALELVDLPRLTGPDTPVAEDLPDFVRNLAAAMERASLAPPVDADEARHNAMIAPFTWRAVFDRVESAWKRLMMR